MKTIHEINNSTYSHEVLQYEFENVDFFLADVNAK